MCENYLVSVHQDDILRILEDSEKDKYFSVNINFLELFESDTNLGNELLTDPESSLKCWNIAAFNVQNNLIKEIDKKYSLKNNVTCRIYSLPPWPHVCRTVFPGNDDANKFLQVTGTVVRMSARKLLEYQRQYICTKCKHPITVEAKYDKRNIIRQPTKCTNPEGCTGKNIITFGDLDPYNCKDYQEIKIQEDLSKMGVGSVPCHMVVTLEDDLVNICKPGENVTITGIVKRRWSEFEKGVKITVDIVLKSSHIQVNNSTGLSISVSDDMREFFDNFWTKYRHDPLAGRNIILNSIAPEIYGRQLVKLAIAVVLAGGSRKEESQDLTGVDTRSESHLLLIGDPGTGKSQMLRFASKIVSRSVLTTGVGSTAAGLTVTAIMEKGEWQLEAGALVMADGGICCIDEFNSMREHDRTSIHEAMEQQTISVAKAGIVCKLKTRCSILAACNPKGNIDPSQPLCVNVAMSSPLLSRFDLILLLRDIVSEENDMKLAEYLLNKSCELSGEGIYWSLEKLQAYYAVIKKESPELTTEAETILSTYYQLQRKFGSRNKSRTTVRLLESLIRLSQGHAKLINHSEVQVIDTIFAIILVDAALDYESSLFNLKVDYDSFFDNPEHMYWELLETILGKLNLDHIYQREIEKMGISIKKISQNTDTTASQKQEKTSPNVGDHRIFLQNAATSTPKRNHPLLFSYRTTSQKHYNQTNLNNTQNPNRGSRQSCEHADVQNTDLNKSQILFTQSQQVRQNRSIIEFTNQNNKNASQTISQIIDNSDNMTGTHREPKLLFSQRAQKKMSITFNNEKPQTGLNHTQNTNQGGSRSSKHTGIQNNNLNKPRFLFTQRSQQFRQNRSVETINDNNQTICHTIENFSNDTGNQKALQLLFSPRPQEESSVSFETSPSDSTSHIAENHESVSNLLSVKNSRGFNNIQQNVCNDSASIRHARLQFTNVFSHNRSNLVQQRNNNQNFSIYQNNNDLFKRSMVSLNLENVSYPEKSKANSLNFSKGDEESGFVSQNSSIEHSHLTKSIVQKPSITINKNETNTNTELPIKESRFTETENDNLGYKRIDNNPKKRKKRDSNYPSEGKEKHCYSNEVSNEANFLNFLPSVNDDFKKYSLDIDWDMEENNQVEVLSKQSDSNQMASNAGVKEALNGNIKKYAKIAHDIKGQNREKKIEQAPKFGILADLQKFGFVPREQRMKENKEENEIRINVEDNMQEQQTTGVKRISNNSIANDEVGSIASRQGTCSPSEKFKCTNKSMINKLNDVSSDNCRSSPVKLPDGNGNKSAIEDSARLELKKFISEVDLDKEFLNFDFTTPFNRSNSFRKTNENGGTASTAERSKEIFGFNSNFGTSDMDTEKEFSNRGKKEF